MPRTSIDVGIDLGTTNSAVAIVQQGTPFIVTNNQGGMTTPSTVRIDKRGTMTVGAKAYDFLMRDPQNTAGEFKRHMGQPTPFEFKDAGRTLSAPQLSAEVLKSLRADLQRHLNETVTAAVITVPAAFDLTQCAATQEAAALAGITQAVLLQEPIAASLAYGYRVDLEGKNWLVYDLGGGTFDLALIGVRDGRIQVIDHEGDNHLGGTDMDWLLVEQIVLPLLGDRWAVKSFDRANPSRRSDLAKLKASAEEAKIELSVADSVVLTIEPGVSAPMVDDDGREIEADIVIQRDMYEAAVKALVDRTIRLSQELLSRNPGTQPDAVLMVGGPTLTPAVRTAVSIGLGIRIDSSANPLTVVAEGAALYAAAQPASQSTVAAPIMAGTIAIAFDYRTVTDDESVLVGAKLPPEVAAIEFVAADRSWSSGRLSTASGKLVTRLPLRRKGTHTFAVVATEIDGNVLIVNPVEITVTRGLTAGAAPLSRSLGVVYEDTASARVHRLIPKNAPLPARVTYEFRTTIALEPGGEIEIIRIHLVEGENDRPERNRSVGEVLITDQMVGRRVPAGSPIEVTIEVDESRLLTAKAYLPLVDQTFAAQIKIGGDTVDSIRINEEVALERDRIAELSAFVSAGVTRELHEEIRAVEQRAQRGPDDGATYRDLQEVQKRLDQIEKSQELPRAMADAREESEMASQVVMDHGDDGHRARLRALIAELDAAEARNALLEIRRTGEKLGRLRFEILRAQPAFWVGYFGYLVQEIKGWTDNQQADRLIREGKMQIVREELDALSRTVIQLNGLVRPADQSRAAAYQNVGISL